MLEMRLVIDQVQAAGALVLEEHVERLQDRAIEPACRSCSWQIGTEMIESTAKQLVGIRLK